jgi:ubiquinone/menaquinone biosynthesis C-methylase UbiE
MKRVVVPELLDEDLGNEREIQDSLLDLRGLNEHFGGFSSMSVMLDSIAARSRKRALSFLDVAGGTGEVAENVMRLLSQKGISIDSTVLDRAISHMKGHGASISRIAGDALSLPLRDESYDVVGCNLFCHHLERPQMVQFFNEAIRVARLAVIASDLRRTLFHLLAAYAGRLIYRSRVTRHDAPVSVRRAYTIGEISSIAQHTNAARFEVGRYHFQRFGLVLWKAA